MTNLLEETKEIMALNGQSPEDIIFIGSSCSNYSCTWEEFILLADQEYDSGFGNAEVAIDLIIAFRNSETMTRGEYDGKEWWNYNKKFVPPTETRPINQLFSLGGEDLAEINIK